MEKASFTSKEVADILGVSDRTVRRYLSSYFISDSKGFSISIKMLELLKSEHLRTGADNMRTGADNMRTGADIDDSLKEIDVVDYDIVEGFSTEEYQEFQKRLVEYPKLVKDLEYHKKSSESHQRQMEMILNIMSERNYIEAVDKNLDVNNRIKKD